MTYYPGQPVSPSEANAPYQIWRRQRPGADDPRTPLLFWFTVLALGCVALLGTTWAASNVLAQKGSEKLLRVSLLLPKLKSIHGDRKADAFRMSEPAPSAEAHLKDRNTTATHHLPPVIDLAKGALHSLLSPRPHLIPPVELAPPHVETCDEPVIYLNPCTLQRGDSPMMRNWKMLTMYSLLGVATLAPPPPIAFADDTKLDELTKTVQQLTKSVDALGKSQLNEAAVTKIMRGELTGLKQDINDLKTSVNDVIGKQLQQKIVLDSYKTQIDLLNDEVARLNKRLIAGNGSASPAPAVDDAFMKELRSYLKTLNETIAKLGTPEKRLSMSPPNGTAATTGRVVFVNTYADDLLVIINGTNYKVRANSTRVIENVQAGPLRYEVMADRFGVLANRVDTLDPGSTYTLWTARP